MKEAGLAARLHYDAYERRSGLVRFLAPATDPDAWALAEAVELGDAVDGAFVIAELGLDRLVATRAAHVRTATGAAAVDVTKDDRARRRPPRPDAGPDPDRREPLGGRDRGRGSGSSGR